ncbi:hypothetical protein GCK72_001216 [Caenorhabditis remanei]|uniref:Uncharacterized protein n=1 Tax=Caenorhabditis remanei TaxID=31234 RepID=A0A6A5HP14_CAERE|nr:hypothetical protein GCK72_001216 [Caenorhabditis remanei]KAF1769399.1 hypothetical protein GCK72_001216 [Caenorhabditis remanei]
MKEIDLDESDRQHNKKKQQFGRKNKIMKQGMIYSAAASAGAPSSLKTVRFAFGPSDPLSSPSAPRFSARRSSLPPLPPRPPRPRPPRPPRPPRLLRPPRPPWNPPCF